MRTHERSSVIKIEIIKNNLFSSTQKPLEISNGWTSFGSEFHSKKIGAKSIYNSWLTFIHELQVKNPISNDSIINGGIVYRIKFLTDYAQIKLSKKDINKSFTINNNKITLVDVVYNNVVLKVENLENSLNIINFDNDGNILTNFPYFELLQMKKTDSTINEKSGFSRSTAVLYKGLFDYFKQNPNITLDEFKKNISIEQIQLFSQGERYFRLSTVANINNYFILYEPIWGISKEIEVNIK